MSKLIIVQNLYVVIYMHCSYSGRKDAPFYEPSPWTYGFVLLLKGIIVRYLLFFFLITQTVIVIAAVAAKEL